MITDKRIIFATLYFIDLEKQTTLISILLFSSRILKKYFLSGCFSIKVKKLLCQKVFFQKWALFKVLFNIFDLEIISIVS